MRRDAFFNWTIFLVMMAFLLPFGCAKQSIKTIEVDPENLYKQGLVLFNQRDYFLGLKKFEQLKTSFPDSPPFTLWAELKIGDCHFFKGEYVEAIAAYEDFKKTHPTHEEIPYVQYQIGMAYFNQMLSFDRDQTSTKKAISNFEYLIANTPPSLFTEKAKEKIEVCKKRLADHEFYIGDFYYKQEKFQAAVHRFEGLLENFPKVAEEDRALIFLGKSYFELDQWEKAEGAFKKILADYPKSFHYKEAKAFLDLGIKGKKSSLRQAKGKEVEKKGEAKEAKPAKVALAKFEEEGKQSAPFPPGGSEAVKPIPSQTPSPQENRLPEIESEKERRVASIHSKTSEEERGRLKREKVKKEILREPREPGQNKLVDKSQPIDITSDRAETYSKENLIVFKGNVIARQKDIVIYADSLEATTMEDGKGIEKVVADGNVKIQQGPRVASCQKAVFYNLDQRVILTGDPKVWEGENMVSGEEIIFEIEQNRVDVKGGQDGRSKARIHPGAESEKVK